MTCYDFGKLTSDQLNKLATQYRDSLNLRDFFQVYLMQLEEVQEALCNIPLDFDCELSEGVILDRIGAIIGMPRSMCNVVRRKFFGFSTNGYNDSPNLLGFGTGKWIGDNQTQYINYTFSDDDLYRQYICCKILANSSSGSLNDLLAIAKCLYGQNACVKKVENEIIISTGRALDNEELLIIPIAISIFPAKLGVNIKILVTPSPNIFGFGNTYYGFGGYFAVDFNSDDLIQDSSNSQVFGFDGGHSGFLCGMWGSQNDYGVPANSGVFAFGGDISNSFGNGVWS